MDNDGVLEMNAASEGVPIWFIGILLLGIVVFRWLGTRIASIYFKPPPKRVFGTTIEIALHCHQIESLAQTSVPRIVSSSISAIKRLGGLTEEGIFRISIPSNDLIAMRDRVMISLFASLHFHS
jgi:hypothetical protein